MDLSLYIKPLFRWWWLLVASTLVAAISTLITVRQQPNTYQAKSTVMIGRLIEDPNPTSGDFYLAEQLAASYADIANRKPIRDATMASLNLDFLPSYLARAVPSSPNIEIWVTDIDPLRAQVVANELARQLILLSPTQTESNTQVQQDFLFGQIEDVQSQIGETNEEIARLQDRLANTNSASELQDTREEIAAQQQKLTTLQGTYAALLANTEQGATNSLILIEQAELPLNPIGPNKMLLVLMASGIGFALAAGAAYLLDYLDDTIKLPEDVSKATNLHTLGTLAKLNGNGEGYAHALIAATNPRAPEVESYRVLRTNIQALSNDQPLCSILITGPGPSEGKSVCVANLAIVMAQAGLKVVLVDADLRRPVQHEIFNLKNEPGLGDALLLLNPKIDHYLLDTDIDNLLLLPSGSLPESPAELLGSESMEFVIEELKSYFDIVLFDGPPVLPVADALILGPQVDGLILVSEAGRTRKGDLRDAIEELHRTQSSILGVVLNRVSPRKSNYYYRYYRKQGSENDDHRNGNQQGNWLEREVLSRIRQS